MLNIDGHADELNDSLVLPIITGVGGGVGGGVAIAAGGVLEPIENPVAVNTNGSLLGVLLSVVELPEKYAGILVCNDGSIFAFVRVAAVVIVVVVGDLTIVLVDVLNSNMVGTNKDGVGTVVADDVAFRRTTTDVPLGVVVCVVGVVLDSDDDE